MPMIVPPVPTPAHARSPLNPNSHKGRVPLASSKQEGRVCVVMMSRLCDSPTKQRPAEENNGIATAAAAGRMRPCNTRAYAGNF